MGEEGTLLKSLQEEAAAETLVALMGLQRSLQGPDLTAPEAAQDARLQATGFQSHTTYK